jgi:hypothetical protein
MKLLMRYASIPVLALGLLARPASAQLNSLPVFYSPKGGSGFTLAASYGMGVNDDSEKNTTWAARASIGIQELTIGGGIATVNPEISTGNREQEIQWMANLAYRVFGGALVPVAVSLQGGVGHLSHQVGGAAAAGEATEWRFPIGVGVAFNIPTPGFSFEPWIAPRADILRSEEEIAGILAKKTRGGFGVSAGVNLGFAMGLGLHTAIDWSSLPETSIGFFQFPEAKPVTIGIGLHYSFRLPGIPLAPGV